ncbi:nucleoside hydrolase [Kribbella capetownensis]|uniref:Nucleoside hydrolase n=2 Tax=Kribbella capetownensis TaxID=1572659 RepID=A0A4R0JV11_9ACTN|nr:nucleoside hydrolase [Kribbella capetownensis]TCC49018.1 nucleoside hydrolase [Kribbella capetownensis]
MKRATQVSARAGRSRFRKTVAALAAGAALSVASVGVAPATAATVTETAGHRPVPVVYDSDLDFDDASTLAFLCQAHKQGRIELRAVTVVNNGIGTAGRSLTHARTILRKCGLPRVPVADGSPTGVHQAPPEARETFERVLTGALDDADQPDQPSALTAAQLIARSVLSSRDPVTVLATGPVSNVAAALREHRGVAQRIASLYMMGGAFDVPGNLFGSTTGGFDNTQEVNLWIDPNSADFVFKTMPAGRVRIVPLDATNHVMITQAYVDRLGASARTVEARLVHTILTQPDLPPLIELDIMFWWDALAATSLVLGPRDDLVQYQPRRVSVVLDGASSGRTIDSPDGTPQLAGYTADGARFEDTFTTTLNGGRHQLGQR